MREREREEGAGGKHSGSARVGLGSNHETLMRKLWERERERERERRREGRDL